MKPADVRKKSRADLEKLLRDLEEELRNFRFGMSGGRIKNVKRARELRKDIARIHTILSEKK